MMKTQQLHSHSFLFSFLENSMARISLISTESANAEVKEIYEKTLRGKPGNAQKALAHRPEMLKNFLSFYPSVGRSLDRKLYELIYLRVSFINQCHYCLQHHVASSKRVGLTAEDWSALKAGDYSRCSEKERAALVYVEKLTRTPHDITDADFALLTSNQFSEPEIVDIHLLTGLANLTNRFTDPLGLEVEFPEEKI
jgi:uncharacterized peroxidase-related enzyme